MEENYVDLNRADYVSNIPAVYYNATASIIENLLIKVLDNY